ncbi:hypothetical protein M404DRAFT_991234 [Pisolithus tinctorius Marx 270]|uniref:Uncharacterized protein n=1 Tax=Pisolithus tinctorius Marx 270 TaxID=870435 RepID=A0A0C3KY75_PISTI|nr:hypothetical protein M404DRAFT_991234 [Pisolithus tinctorius Marx 270]
MLWGPAAFKSLTKYYDHSNTFINAQYLAAFPRLHDPNTDMAPRTIENVLIDAH